jgi:hypothetical protein
MSSPSLLPFQPMSMTTAQLAAVSFLARYAGRTHDLYAYQLRRWFGWCEGNGLDPLLGIQRAHVELYIRGLGEAGLMASSTNTMMHGVRGFFRFAHIDGLIPADPAVYARLPKVHPDESRTHGLDRLELIRFLQVAQTITVHHGALAYLLGINALRASEAATEWSPGSRRLPASLATSALTRCVTRRSPTRSTPACHCATRRSSLVTPTREPPSTTTVPAATSTDTASLPHRLRRRRVADKAAGASTPPKMTWPQSSGQMVRTAPVMLPSRYL